MGKSMHDVQTIATHILLKSRTLRIWKFYSRAGNLSKDVSLKAGLLKSNNNFLMDDDELPCIDF